MFLTDLLRQIVLSLWRHKVRSSLSLFGIIWGTVAVILLLAIANGFYAVQMKNLSFLKNATIVGWPGTTSKPFAGLPQGQKVHIHMDAFLQWINSIPHIKEVSPVLHVDSKARYQNHETQVSIQAVSASYQNIMQIDSIPHSRFINTLDIKNQARVVFLDASVKQTLFGKESALQKQITLDGIPFTVIGVFADKQKSAIKWMGNNVFMPYTTLMAISGQEELHTFFIQPNHAADVKSIKQNLRTLLARMAQFDPTDEEAIHMPDMESAQLFITWFFRAVSLFLGICGGLTLSVGGLGIANMMFLIVTERTREIGMRMAIGANHSQIMRQFFCETLFLVALGGLLGFLLSVLIIIVLNHLGLPDWLGSPVLSGSSVLMTLLILLLVGTLAGYFPARRAANLAPVQALAF